MSASYSSAKLVKPPCRKPRIKVISSKVHLHRPGRPRSQVGHKGEKSPTIKEVSFATGPKMSFDLKTRHPPQEMTEKLNKPSPYPRNQRNKTGRCPLTPATPSRTAKPKKTFDFKTRCPLQEMAEKSSKPNPYPRHQSNKTGRCPQTTARIHSRNPDSGIAGARKNFGRSYPPNTVYRVRRGRSSDQRQKRIHPPDFPQKIKQVSAPRRNMEDLEVEALCGNRDPARIISVPVATPKLPLKERPAAFPVKRSSGVAATRVPNGPFLTFFEEKVSLSKDEIGKTSSSVNNIVSQILDEIRKIDLKFALKILHSGSYYERLKVSHPAEFDVMLVFESHLLEKFFKIKCESRGARVGFARLKFNDHVTDARKHWGKFLTSDGKSLSPRITAKYFYQLVCKAVAAMRVAQRRQISKVKWSGTAVTLTIDGNIDLDLVLSVEISGWPNCACAWGDNASNDASNKTWPTERQVEQIKIEKGKVHLVAKPCPAERGVPFESQEYWRISFSEAEKMLLRPASSGCEKKYYRIAKAIFEARKEDLKPLSSYQLKTLFLHLRRESPQARSDDSNLGESVVKFFASLIDRLKKGQLPHFFVGPRADLFSEMSGRTRTNLACKLEYFLNKLVENPGEFLRGLNI